MAVDPLVTTGWLQEHLSDPDLRVVDIRGYVTTQSVAPRVDKADYRGAIEEYRAAHIPGAVFIDWTRDIVDLADPVPVQLAPADRFARAMADRGIGDASRVIAVDHAGGQFATRLWWALSYYGHDAVSVLDGGWKRWVEEGRPIETGEPAVAVAAFTPRPRPNLRVAAEALLSQLGASDLQLLDARDADQYHGTRRRGPRGGHIPGAQNVPRELFFAEAGGFLPLDEIRHRVEAQGLKPDARTIVYCNGGVAATVVLFSLHRLGFGCLANYDGSWNEWGRRLDLPVEPC
jgi:thiosulfate/3-mercaptopyruvate sulfurtransferase